MHLRLTAMTSGPSKEKLTELVRRLVEQGVISAQRWKEFSGEAER